MEAPPLRLGVKGKRADLDAAFGQLRLYALALENPPLLIVSDMLRFRIRTNWTNSVSKTYEFGLDDLTDAATRNRLKWAVSDPGRLRPGETRQSLTEQAAQSFATVAQSLRERRHAPNARLLVASRGTAAGYVAGARRAVALHRDAERRQAPTVCLVRRPRLPRSSAHRDRQRRRYDLRHPAQPISRDLVTAPLHVAREGALLRGSKTDPQRPLPTDPLTIDSIRRRPTKLSHLIEDVTCEDGLRLLPRPTARSKALPDDQLVPEEGVLHTGLLMVARVLLPLSPSSLLHLSDRAVARGRSWSPSRHGGCPGRWNDDRRATRTRSLVDATRVVGRVRREAGDVAFDLVDQIEGRRRVVNMPAGQGVSDDHARSVDAQMKLLPAASTASAMFHGRPFTFTHSREPGTVDDEMYACARGEAAKCKVEVLTTP